MTNIPQGFVCCGCKTPFPQAMSMVGNEKPRIAKGAVMVCAHCGLIHVLGDSQLSPMTEAQWRGLDMKSQRAIAIVRQQIDQRIASQAQN